MTAVNIANEFPINSVDRANHLEWVKATIDKCSCKKALEIKPNSPAYASALSRIEKRIDLAELRMAWRTACRAQGVNPDDSAFLAGDGPAWEAYNDEALAFSKKWGI